MKPRVALIVLAAGLSKRFGRNKLLEKIEGKTVIERVVSEALKSKVDDVIVVVGHEAERIEEVLKNLPCKLVFNEDYLKGQSSSVKKGLSVVKELADAVMVLPGDVALVDSKMMNAIIDEYKKGKSSIVVAGYRERSGHPILIGRELFREVEQIDEATMGLKKVMKDHFSKVKIIETSEAALMDFDTPEEFVRLKERLG